jgi:hypothetical protein
MEVKGSSFWVKTEGKSKLIVFATKDEAMMSFKNMEEAIMQDATIAEFKYSTDPKGNATWSIEPVSWREIAKARLELQQKKKET